MHEVSRAGYSRSGSRRGRNRRDPDNSQGMQRGQFPAAAEIGSGGRHGTSPGPNGAGHLAHPLRIRSGPVRPDGYFRPMGGEQQAGRYAARRTSFGGTARDYDAVRPEWPGGTVSWMLGAPAPGTALSVVDLGCGTGKG